MPHISQTIAQLLLDKQAVKISIDPPFTWTSGIKSPIYCDNRILTSFVDAQEILINAFIEKIESENLEFDIVAGVATGAITWGVLVANRLQKPFVYIRPEPRSHGTGKQVEGIVSENKKVLVIEDLFSTAGSSVKAVEALRKETRAEVIGIIAISTYEFDLAEKRLQESNINWWTLTNFSSIVSLLEIEEEKKRMILNFASNPENWWDKVNTK